MRLLQTTEKYPSGRIKYEATFYDEKEGEKVKRATYMAMKLLSRNGNPYFVCRRQPPEGRCARCSAPMKCDDCIAVQMSLLTLDSKQ